ncbi:MAG TPA: C10 family peptidase [Bacteroidia bacterium]
MKKIIYTTFMFILGINMVSAKPVTPTTAKTVAENFYKQNSNIEVSTTTLAYTAVSATGVPIYYIFDINSDDGFVIISADDVAKPIVGYSTKGHYVKIESGSNFGYWMEKTSYQINSARTNGLAATEKVVGEWTKYTTKTSSNSKLSGTSSVMTATFVPLMLSTWNQNGGGSVAYNNLCPGGSVTGCVATTMAQIMRYWSYPAHGTGSSSYTQSPNTHGYPSQSANYGTTTYNWANMPLNASNADVAQLSYQCGVSVNMHYDPTGSGAQVLGSGGPSAQHSYKTYFGYDPNQLRGLYKSSNQSSYDVAWIDSVKSDLNIGRPVQYAGWDSLGAGHTWVCDGYDNNNNLHMNWGWGGAYDGYFSIMDLTTSGGTSNVFDPRYNDQMLKGIVPMSANSLDAGISVITSPVGYYCSTTTNAVSPSITLQNFGSTSLFVCSVNYKLDNLAVQNQPWNGSLVPYQTAVINLPNVALTIGTHTLVCYSSNPNGGTDQNSANDQTTIIFNVTGSGILPVVEGFESATTLPNSNWNVSHTSTTSGVDFMVTSNGSATGSRSCMIDNMSNIAGNNSIIQTSSSYDMTTFTTPSLTFKAAYQKKPSATNVDKLQISTSTDCGNSWQSRKVISSSTLATGGVGTSSYIPTTAQFALYTVPITAIASSHTVMFRFEFYADPTSPGNNLYIDDINIIDAAGAGIQSIEEVTGLNIYPNPSTGKFNIDLNLSESHNIAVTITDMLGRTVETTASKPYLMGKIILAFGNNNAYQTGVYLVNIDIDGQRISKKVVIQ